MKKDEQFNSAKNIWLTEKQSRIREREREYGLTEEEEEPNSFLSKEKHYPFAFVLPLLPSYTPLLIGKHPSAIATARKKGDMAALNSTDSALTSARRIRSLASHILPQNSASSPLVEISPTSQTSQPSAFQHLQQAPDDPILGVSLLLLFHLVLLLL